MRARIISFPLVIVSIFFLPLPLALAVFVIMLSVYTNYFEGLIAGMFLDTVYYSPLPLESFGIGGFTVSFLLLILFVSKFRKLLSQKNTTPIFVIALTGVAYFSLLFFLINNAF